jgi:Putative Actinobacterial Holin-X, holin superfamily III
MPAPVKLTRVSTTASEPRGVRASARRAIAHFRAITQLEKELASVELKEKAGAIGLGAGLGIAAAVMALFAVGFMFATIATALALVLPWWLSLLIVFGLLLLITLVLALLAKASVQRGTPLAPEQAIAEAQLTKQALRSDRGS